MTDEQINVDDLFGIEKGGLTEEEMDELSGTKTTIASHGIIDRDSRYQDGKELPGEQTVSVKKLEVRTAPIGTDKAGNQITVTEEFNLKIDKVTGKWGWSKHEKSNSFKFLNSLKINHFTECIDKPVVVVKKVTDKGRPFLGINY